MFRYDCTIFRESKLSVLKPSASDKLWFASPLSLWFLNEEATRDFRSYNIPVAGSDLH
jgi:hypothetical protein